MANRPSLPDKYQRIASGDLSALDEPELSDEDVIVDDPGLTDDDVTLDEPAFAAGRLTGPGESGDVLSVDQGLFRPKRKSISEDVAPASGKPAKPYTAAQQEVVDRGYEPFDPAKGDRMGGRSMEDLQEESMGPAPSRPGIIGGLKSTGIAFARGLVKTAPQQVFGMIGGAGDIAERAGLPDIGQGMENFADEQIAANQAFFGDVKGIRSSKEDLDPEGSFIRKAAVSGAEDLPFSLATAGPLGLGGAFAGRAVAGMFAGGTRAAGLLAKVGGPAAVGGAVGGGLGGTAFGLSEYYGALKEGQDAGLDLETAREMAEKSGMIEGLGETVANAVLGGVVGRALKPWKDAAAAAVKSGDTSLKGFLSPTLKQNLIKAAGVQAVESGTEFGQEFGEAKVREQYGVPTEDPLYAGALGAASAVFMGGLFGLGAIQLQRQERERLLADINSLSDPAKRIDAVAQIHAGLKETDDRMANLWGAAALANVMRGEQVPIDASIINASREMLETRAQEGLAPTEYEMPAIRERAENRLQELEGAKRAAQAAGARLPPEFEAELMWIKGISGDDARLAQWYARRPVKPGQTIDMKTGLPVAVPDSPTTKKSPVRNLTDPSVWATAAGKNQVRGGMWGRLDQSRQAAKGKEGLFSVEPVGGEGVVTSGQEGQGAEGLLEQPQGAGRQTLPKGPPALPPLPARRGVDAPAPPAAAATAGPAKPFVYPKGPPPLPGRQAPEIPAAEAGGYNPANTPKAPPLPARPGKATPAPAPVPGSQARTLIPKGPPPIPAIQTRTALPKVAAIPSTSPVAQQARGEARPEIATAVDEAAHAAATSPLNDLEQPTEAQREAGNFKKGHVAIQGLDVSIENPKGSVRTGTRPDGNQWSTTLQHHYGYIKGTVGKDGDHVDAFIGESTDSERVFIVNQNSPETGRFDEHKVMLGFNSMAEAKEAYLSNYEAGWQGLGSIVPMSMDQFKEWKDKGARTVPARPSLVTEKKTTGGPRRPVIPEGLKPQRGVARPEIPVKEEPANAEDQEEAPAAPAEEEGTTAQPPGRTGAEPVPGEGNAPGDDVAPAKSLVEQELADNSLEDLLAVVESGGKTGLSGEKSTPAGEKTGGPRTPPLTFGPKSAEKGAGDLLAKAAKEVGAGAEDALRGLWKLFGGPGGGPAATSGGISGLDRESYEAAKPHFQKAWEHWKTAGKSFQEFVKFILANLPGSKLHLSGFIYEMKTGQDPIVAEEEAPAVEEPAVEAPAAEEEAPPAEVPEQDETIGTGDEFTVENVGAEENTGGGGKRPRKEKAGVSGEPPANTFTDKGEVWDPYKRALDKAAADATETSIKKVIAQAARSKVFSFTPQEGAAPGVARYAASIRDEIYTFQEHYVRNVLHRYTATGIENKIIGRIKGWTEGSEQQIAEMDSLKTEAAKYMAFAAEIAKALNAKNVAEARANIKELLWKKEIHKDLGREWRAATDENNATEFTNDNRRFFSSTLNNIYRTIASANFEQNENDERIGARPFNRTFRKDITRVGLEDYRKGKNIASTDEFDAPFEFKGVAFGTWVDQKERQRVTNGAFDALHDLAMVMGIDTRKIPFTSRMQIQFGNIGTLNSRAAALYVPTADAINLSKTSGDGALAHEWGHALDKHIKSEGAVSAGGVEVREARQDLYKRLSYRLDFEAGEAFVKGLFGQMEYYRRYMRQGSETALETIKRVASQGYEAAVKVDSEFQSNAEKAPNSQYYSKNEELWARAFEAWVYDQLKEKDGENSYLVDEFSSDGFLTPENGYKATIYPAGEERKQFNEYFTAFTKALRFNEDGTIGIDPAYEMIQAKDLALIIEQREALLARIEELYNEKFPAVKSEDGLYWYAYKEMKRAKTMQPEGYFAYDDSHFSGEEGQGAVGYPAPLSLDQMLDFHLAAISHVANDKTVYLKEGEENVEEPVEGPRGVALEDDETEDVSNTGGGRVPGGSSGLRGEPSEEGLPGSPETGGERGSGEGDRDAEVDIPPEREGGAGATDGQDAVPPAASNYLILDAAALSGSRTVAERFSDNVAAIRTLKAIEDADRLPTAEEKDILAQYSGWGGLGESLSDYGNYVWESKREIIKKIMTKEERQGLAESADVAYFTPADIYVATYKALEHMGFTGGNVLGPALGVGREFGTLPAHLRGPQTTFMAVEPEPFSYRISKLLYGQASIKNTTFEKARLPLNYFDLGISNVPFRSVAPFDKTHNKEGFVLHDYFFRKQLHLLRPGGMIAFITSTGTMDKEAALLRNTLVKEGGEFVAAFRLPAIHNQASALADLIFIRKTVPGAAFESPAWQKTKDFTATGGSVSAKVNEYFVDHPERVLGTARVATNRWGDLAMIVDQRQGENPADLIEAAIPSLPKDIMKQERVEEEIRAEDLLPAPGEVRNKTYFIKDGVLYYNDNGTSLPQEGEFKAEFVPIVKALVGLKESIWDLFRAESNGFSEETVVAARKALNEKYDEFVKEYGYVSDSASLIEDDEQMPMLVALEKRDESSDTVSKADIFTMRTLPKYVIPTHADSVDDALIFSLSYRGRADLKYIQGLTGMNQEMIFEQLQGRIFDDPASGITTADDYLSGNVKEKLRQAEASAKVDKKYQANVDALKAVQPAEIPTSAIYMPLGSPIVPAADIAAFLDSHLELGTHRLKAIVKHSGRLNAWSIKFTGNDRWGRQVRDSEVLRRIKWMQGSSMYQKHGVRHKEGTAIKLVTAMLNSQPIVLKMRVPNESGEGYKLKIDDKLTTLANDRAAALQEAWDKHWKTSDRAAALSTIYNETNNTEVLYKADGSHLARTEKNPGALPGMSAAVKLNPHQLNAIWRYITKGSLYLAHEVGTGKTFVMTAIAMEARRLGLKKKPVFLADGPAKIRQVEGDILQLYPLAKVLVIDVKEDLQKQKIALSRIRTGDYDIVVMTKQSFQRIPLSPEQESVFLQSQVDELIQYESMMDKSDKKTVAAVAKKIAALKSRIEKLLAQKVGGDLDSVYFDDLGIDLILADEAHDFKNIPFETKLRGQGSKVRGLSGKASGRATDFFAKSMFMNAAYPRGIVMASGTPLTNSIAELYNISRILQPQELERRGVGHFDAWVSMFGQIKSEPEFSPSMDGYRMAQKITMMNLPELKKMFRSVMDYVSTAEAGIKVPEIRGGKPENVNIEQNQDLATYQAVLLRRTQAYLADPKHAEWNGIPDNMMVIVGQGKIAANDMRLLDSSYKEQENSKLVQSANRIYAEWKATTADKGVQLVFSDLGAPGWAKGEDKKLPQDALDAMEPDARLRYETAQFEVSNSGWNFYEGLKEKLVSMGVPAEEIEFIQSAPSGEKARDRWYKKTFQAVRDGKIRVFLGSSKTLGTGVNVQDRVTAIHHIDIWWTAADWLQRNGRGIRQGNLIAPKYGGVAIYNYGVKKTADAFVWDKVQTKLKTISSVESTNMSLRVVEDVSDDVMSAIEAAAVFSGDTTYVELAKVQAELRKLEYRESEFQDDRKRAETDLQKLPGRLQAAQKSIERTKEDLALLEPADAVVFDGDPEVYVFEKHGKAIAAKLETIWKDKAAQAHLDISVSAQYHIATLGKATEKVEAPVEPALDAEGKPVKAEKPKKSYDFADVPVRVYMRKFTVGLQGLSAGVVLGLSGKLSVNMEKPFTEGVRPDSMAKIQVFKMGELFFEEAKAGKMGTISETTKVKGQITEVTVSRTDKTAIDNPIVGNLSRTVTLSKSALEAKAEQSAKEAAALSKSEAELMEVMNRTFPETEKILELREQRARLEQQQRDQAAGGQAPTRATAQDEEEDETDDDASFSAPAGWAAIEPGTDQYRRPVEYVTGPDSRELGDLKHSLANDKRFKGDPEMRARIAAIQEVQAPADADATLSEQIRKIMGPEAKVVFVDSAGMFREVQHSAVDIGDVVYVDIRSPQILSTLVAHGLWHADKSRYKQALIDVLKQTVDPKKFQAMAREFRAVPAYAKMSDDKLFEEFGARFLEGQVAQESFWQALSKRSRVVYLRMARWVVDTLNKLGIQIGGKPPVWGEMFSNPEKMAAAVRAAQDYFLGKLGDLGQGQPATAGARFSGIDQREDIARRALIDEIASFRVRPITELRAMPMEKLKELRQYLVGREAAGSLSRHDSPISAARFSAPLFSVDVPGLAENPMVPPGTSAGASAEQVVKSIRKDPTWGKVFLKVPDKDLSAFVRLSALPWWIAKTDKQGRAVMNVQLRRDDERNEMFVALTRSQAGAHISEHAAAELEALFNNKGGQDKTTVEDIVAMARNPKSELHKFLPWKTPAETTRRASALLRRGQMHEFLSLDFKEAEALGRIIVESDSFVERDGDGKITRAGKVFDAEELKSRGFNDKQVTAYYAWKNGMDAAWETKLGYAESSIFWPYAHKPWARAEVRTSGPMSLRALPVSDLEKVSSGAMTMKAALERIKDGAAGGGYNADSAAKEFALAFKRVQAPFEKIKKYREQWGKVKFYMPRFRDQGPIVIRVPGEGEGAKDLYYERFEAIPGTSLSRAAKVAYDKAVEEYGYDNVEFYRSPVIPENIYGDISEAALEKFVGRSIGRLKEDGEISEEEAETLTESLFQELANDLNVRGFGQRSMPRAAGVPTKGYKEDHFQEVYRDYMSGMSGFLSKRRAAMEFHWALSEMRPKTDKEGKPTGAQRWNAFDYWRRYSEDMLRNQDRGDELSAKVRSLAFIYFISGNLKGAVVNLTQSFVSTIPVGSTITKGAEGKVLKAMRDIAFGRLTPREKKALQEAHDRGETTAQYIEDVMDKANAGGKDAIMKRVGVALSLPFRKAEIFNRKSAFLFAFRVYEQQGKPRRESMELARDFVNDTQYMFGKANLPEWARSGSGVGKVLRTSYTFRSYSHNYLNAMAHFLSKDPESGNDAREFMVLARSLAYLALLGGAGAGLPFLDDLLDILERLTGIQWRAQARHYLANTFGPVAEKFWMAGLPGMFGSDISGSLKIGLPGISSPEETLYGVYGGMINKGSQAIQMATSQQYLRAGETLLPSFASNPLRAAREATQGARTTRGSVKFDEAGKPLKLTRLEAAGRAVGFRPVRDTLSTQERREFDNLQTYYSTQREKIRGAYRGSEVSERAEIRREAQKYNVSVAKFRGAIPRIDVGDLNKLLHTKPSKGFMKYERMMDNQ